MIDGTAEPGAGAAGADATGPSAWELLAQLPLRVQRCELQPLSLTISEQFRRQTTVIRLQGAGEEGVGEDVVYDGADHDALQADGPPPQILGDFTLSSFSQRLAELELFPKPPEREVSRRYRVWAYESAALDLALRQAGTSLHAVLGRRPRPLRFVVSLRLGEPPSLDPLLRRLQIAPDMRFKLDPTASWDDQLIVQLVELDVVDSVDLKGCYEGTSVDNPADPDLYRRVAEAFPHAWIEDPKLTHQTEAVLAPHIGRVTWDAPIHDVADVKALAHKPSCINVKPSRIGRIEDLLALYDYCSASGIACYGGGQTELGPGRGQIQYLACLFHPDGPNDVAPAGWNLPQPPDGLSSSPLPPSLQRTGFRWED